jgi:hypothetical protein
MLGGQLAIVLEAKVISLEIKGAGVCIQEGEDGAAGGNISERG